jgi:PAS domain S-box-containing protein
MVEHELRLLERFPALIWRSRPPEGLCDWFNTTWLEFRGRTLEQERGTGWLDDGVHPDDIDRVLASYLEAFHARRPFVLEYRMRRHDGLWRWIDDLARPFEEPDGSFGGFIGACYDVTDRRETIDRLQAAQDANTLLLQTAFHDIAAPVTNAVTAVELARRGPPEQLASLLELAGDQLRHLQRLLEGLRDLDRSHAGRLQPRRAEVDLSGLVTSAIESLPSAEHHVHVTIGVDTVQIDPVMFERILTNLLQNAFQHTPAGSTIDVEASRVDDRLEVIVTDDGPGFTPELMQVMFEPYRQGVDGRGRFGLGLSLVQRYAVAHGGNVEVRNVDPHGARFVVSLPLTDLTA